MLILSFCTFVGAKVVKKEQISKSLFHKSISIVQSVAFRYAENGVWGYTLQRHDRIMRYLAYARYDNTMKGKTALSSHRN